MKRPIEDRKVTDENIRKGTEETRRKNRTMTAVEEITESIWKIKENK
jgi:hypothetical protein